MKPKNYYAPAKPRLCPCRAPASDLTNGQSTLEVVIALTLLTVGLTSAVLVVVSGQNLAVDSQESSVALRLAQQSLEATAASAKDSFTTLAYSSSTQDEFLKEIIIATTTDPNTKQITSRVTWRTDVSRSQKVELTMLVTNWFIYQNSGGDTGGGNVSGDWKNPTTLGSIDLGPGNSATGIDVVSSTAYLTASASSRAKPDFFVIDVSNGVSPVILASIDTGPTLNGLDAAGGNYVYTANNSTTDQLQVVDVTNKSAPNVVASITLSGVSGSGAVGQSIFYASQKIYIGTKTATGPEFHIIDVSNPLSPVEAGNFEVGYDINAINVQGTRAYIVSSDNAQELKILDVSDPANISQIGSFDATGTDDGVSIYIVGTRLYLGRSGGTSDFAILDISNISSVQLLTYIDLGGVSLNGIAVRNNLAFLGTSDSNREFQVWDISNPTSSALWSSFNFPQVAASIDYDNNLVYVAVRSNDALRIVTSQ